MLEWLKQERGISDRAIEHFGVHEDPAGVAVFPYAGAEKRRWIDENGKRHFTFTKGLNPSLFGREASYPTVFLCEGETDTLRLWSELDKEAVEGVGVVGIAGIQTWLDSFASEFDGAEVVYVVLDNDADYATANIVDKTWRSIRRALGKKARRIRLPDGVKDLCEFFDAYDLDALRLLTDRSEEGGALWHYTALDLSVDPSPPDWLVDELICKGDLTMMIGEPGIGKSWLSMSLSVAIAEGQTSWLGRKMDPGNGRVLYVDEENPEALIPHRLRLLGLSDEGVKNIRYLHRQGVRLDKRPELLLDEALDWEPTLIVLDSLTRLHTKDENNAGEVAGLFNDGINPLARETGATTLVLHHVNKGESTSSFSRSRGSGDLSASIDSGLDIREADAVGGLNVVQYKSRWIAEGQVIRCAITDVPDDGVRIVATKREHVF